MSSPRVPPRAAPRRISVGKRSPLLSSPSTAYTAPEYQVPPEDYGRLYAKDLLRPSHEAELKSLNRKHNEQIEALKKTLGGYGGRETKMLLARYDKEARSSVDAVKDKLRLETSLRKAFAAVVAVLVILALLCSTFDGLDWLAAPVIAVVGLVTIVARYKEIRYLAKGKVI